MVEKRLKVHARNTGVALVGTYRARQLSWMKREGIYNWPVKADDSFDEATLGKVGELWLYADAKGTRHAFAASFVGRMTRSEFLAAHPSYAARVGVPTHTAYYVFKATSLDYGFGLDNPVVLVRAGDFGPRTAKVRKAIEQYQADGAFAPLEHYLPTDLASVPSALLRICEPGAQMDFMGILDCVEERAKAFSARPKGDKTIRFIDLFAGIGGVRKGFELACAERGVPTQCVFTSEIKPHAIEVLRQNHPDECIHGDITKVDAASIPDFDVLLGGFPCQAFSAAGKRLGFEDTRGTLFFDVARILKEKKPLGFVLENVEGLVNHDKRDAAAPYGHTLGVILATLDELGYSVNWRVLNAKDFGVPQDRKRIYIVGARKCPNLDDFEQRRSSIADILESGGQPMRSKFIDKLLSHYSVSELLGKAIKDKRGGDNNIHSWDFELKGKVSDRQRRLLNALLRERRKHQWAEMYGIDWMDGMPLTLEMIRTFFDDPHLEEMLEDLVEKRYVVKEHPKRRVRQSGVFVRVQDPNLPLGYNIVAGKMSYEVSKVLSPDDVAPTLVAMDMQHLYVPEGDGIRTLSLKEGLGLFGYPKDFKFNVARDLGYDLLGTRLSSPSSRRCRDG